MYISREKGDYNYIQTGHNDRFSHYNFFLGKLKENWPEKRALILMRVYRIVLIPRGHPTILHKYNKIQYGRLIGKKVYWSCFKPYYSYSINSFHFAKCWEIF